MITIENFSKWNMEGYNEVHQNNPLRWMNLKNEGKNVFVPVTRLWKCKDFLNDAVCSYHHKKTYQIYGFKCDPKEFYNYNWQGMPVLLLNCFPSWIDNINLVINPYLEEQGMPPLEPEECKEGWYVNIPQEYMENTFFISTITLLIRMANVDKTCESFQELIKQPLNAGDLTYWKATQAKPMSQFPEKYKDYLFIYKDDKFGVKKDGVVTMTGHMHNCGVVNWGWA